MTDEEQEHKSKKSANPLGQLEVLANMLQLEGSPKLQKPRLLEVQKLQKDSWLYRAECVEASTDRKRKTSWLRFW
jgi:hypothetical protein